MSDDLRCKKCGTPLLDEDEEEYCMCEACLEGAYEAYQERRDFEYWHSDDGGKGAA